MKKLLKFALMAACAFGMTACSDDDNNKPIIDPVEPSVNVTGVYVLSQGNYYSGLNGDLTYYNPATSDYTNGLFEAVNERAFGGTANDAAIYGSKLYIANTDENVLEVANAQTAKSIKQISLSGARRIVADGGYIYVTSFYGNNVTKIDTTTLEIVGTAETGTYPEAMAIQNGKLYVANSGYGSGNTVTKIDLANFTVDATLDVPVNPVEVFSVHDQLYLGCSGEYNDDYTYKVNPAIYALATDGTATKLVEATISAAGKDYIYFIDNNYYKTEVTYGRISATDQKVENLVFDKPVVYPCAIAANPQNGDIYITGYAEIDYGGGYYGADYNSNGTCYRFSADGMKLDQFPVGISAGRIVFLTK